MAALFYLPSLELMRHAGGAENVAFSFMSGGRELIKWRYSLRQPWARLAAKITACFLVTAGYLIGAGIFPLTVPLYFFYSHPLMRTAIIISQIALMVIKTFLLVRFIHVFLLTEEEIKKKEENLRNYPAYLQKMRGLKVDCYYPGLLENFPLDVLKEINHFLEPVHLLEMWKLFLKRKQPGTAGRLSLIAEALLKCPHFIRQIYPFSLQDPIGNAQLISQFYAWKKYIKVEKLTRLDLTFCLHFTPTWQALLVQSPHLTSLNLSTLYAPFFKNSEFLLSLPSTLRSLKFSQRFFDEATFSAFQISQLPPFLEKLQLGGLKDEKAISSLPPTLTILHLGHSLNEQKGSLLPTNLTKLGLVLRVGKKLAKLPSHILHLHLRGYSFALDCSLLSPHLESLKLKGVRLYYSRAPLSSFVPQLKTFIQRGVSFGNFSSSFPSTLMRLEVEENLQTFFPNRANFSPLPPHLTKLTLPQSEALTEERLSFLPPSLTSLTLSREIYFTSQMLSRLPIYLNNALNPHRANAEYEKYLFKAEAKRLVSIEI